VHTPIILQIMFPVDTLPIVIFLIVVLLISVPLLLAAILLFDFLVRVLSFEAVDCIDGELLRSEMLMYCFLACLFITVLNNKWMIVY